MTDPDPPTVTRFPHPDLPDEAYRRTTFLLRAGLVVSLAILIGGVVAYLRDHPGESSGSAISSNPIVQYFSAGGLAQGLLSGAPDAYLALGIFVLIATPILRVLTGVYYFHKGHERQMAAVTFTVLVLLVVGVLVIGPLLR